MKGIELKEDEIYAGAIVGPNCIGYHVILLPGDQPDASWQTQMDWAKSIGGDLPDRVEQALLHKHLSEQFQKYWYWSNTQHTAGSYAWYQDFNGGDQLSILKSAELRARAVRRVAI